jgi:hypothetical protein
MNIGTKRYPFQLPKIRLCIVFVVTYTCLLLSSYTVEAQNPSAAYLVKIHDGTSQHLDTLTGVQNGMLIYNSTDNELYYYSNGGWQSVLDLDSFGYMSNDTIALFTKNTIFKVPLFDNDTLNEKLSSVFVQGDSLAFVEGNDTLYVDYADKDWEDKGNYILAQKAGASGDTVVVTSDGRLGVGVSSPTEKIDVNGTIRLRNVDTATMASDTVLVIQPNGTVLKRKLEFCDSFKCFIQVTNTTTTDINNGTTTFTWINTSSGTHITNASSAFTVANDGITINKNGVFKVTVFQYQEGNNSSRNNASVRLTVNGTVQSGYGANAYQRMNNGHEETTASFVKLISVNSGDKIGIRNDQLAGNGTVTCPAGTLVFIIEEL